MAGSTTKMQEARKRAVELLREGARPKDVGPKVKAETGVLIHGPWLSALNGAIRQGVKDPHLYTQSALRKALKGESSVVPPAATPDPDRGVPPGIEHLCAKIAVMMHGTNIVEVRLSIRTGKPAIRTFRSHETEDTKIIELDE